jgi:hypothetical protein
MGVLKREEISMAIRSCYPDFVVSRRKAVALVDDENTRSVPGNESEVGGFDDVTMRSPFLLMNLNFSLSKK